jgi:hypothetical protein
MRSLASLHERPKCLRIRYLRFDNTNRRRGGFGSLPAFALANDEQKGKRPNSRTVLLDCHRTGSSEVPGSRRGVKPNSRNERSAPQKQSGRQLNSAVSMSFLVENVYMRVPSSPNCCNTSTSAAAGTAHSSLFPRNGKRHDTATHIMRNIGMHPVEMRQVSRRQNLVYGGYYATRRSASSGRRIRAVLPR